MNQVIREAAGSNSLSFLLAGLASLQSAAQPFVDNTKMSRSLLQGLLTLAAFPADGSTLANAQVARMLSMNPSTCHRYISTLTAIGLLERDSHTRRYRLPAWPEREPGIRRTATATS